MKQNNSNMADSPQLKSDTDTDVGNKTVTKIIKARGISKETGEMVYGQVLQVENRFSPKLPLLFIIEDLIFGFKEFENRQALSFNEAIEIIPETLGYATGIEEFKEDVDSEKELFSGDIVEMTLEDMGMESTFVGYIEFSGGAFRFILNESDMWDIDNYRGLKIIGNIHQNKELLEEE